MSSSVTFAGNLTDDPELLPTRDGEPFVAYRGVLNRRIRNEAEEWVDGEHTWHHVTVHGTAVNHFYDSAGGDRVAVHGQLRGEAWREGGTADKRTTQVVTVDHRFGGAGRAPKKYDASRLERKIALALTTVK